MSASAASGGARRLLGVGLLSAAMLGFEILAVRWVSILFFPLAGYVVIALALLGLGASGALLTLRGDRPAPLSRVGAFAAVHAATVLAALFLVWNARPGGWTALALGVALAVPFFFSGLALATLFAGSPSRVSQLYFADLAGAGSGGVAAMLALNALDGASLGLLVAGAGFAGAALLEPGRRSRLAWATAAAAASLIGALAPAPLGPVPVSPKELANALRPEVGGEWEWSRWNPLARVDVVGFGDDRLAPDLPLAYRLVTQDGGAPTLLIRPDPTAVRLSETTVFGIPLWLRHQARMLIIGLGGGPDLLTALEADPARVDVVEVNPAMIELVADRYRGFVGDPLADRRVHLVQGDGRFFIARSDETYDIIQLTGVDTAVASASGSPNLAENYLYTRQAFDLYLRHLAPDGLLAVSFPAVDGLGLRLVNLVYQSLADIGVARPEDHIVVADVTGYVFVLAGRSPFAPGEIARLEQGFSTGVSSVYFPLYHRLWGDPPLDSVARSELTAVAGRPWGGVYGAYLEAAGAGTVEAFLQSQPQSVFAPTDDRPFVFVLDKWGERAPNLTVLAALLLILSVSASALLLGPPTLLRRRGLAFGGRLPLGLTFLAIGLGYILLEVTLIQKMTLFLGAPSLALAVTIGGLLVASAFGSLTAGRWRGRPEVLVAAACGAVALLALLLAPATVWVAGRFLGLSLAARIALALGLIAVPGFFMGMPFPTALAYVRGLRPAFVPWAWGLNATASVAATILALVIALQAGLTAVLVVTAGLYAGAGLSFAAWVRPARHEGSAPAR